MRVSTGQLVHRTTENPSSGNGKKVKAKPAVRQPLLSRYLGGEVQSPDARLPAIVRFPTVPAAVPHVERAH